MRHTSRSLVTHYCKGCDVSAINKPMHHTQYRGCLYMPWISFMPRLGQYVSYRSGFMTAKQTAASTYISGCNTYNAVLITGERRTHPRQKPHAGKTYLFYIDVPIFERYKRYDDGGCIHPVTTLAHSNYLSTKILRRRGHT